MVWTPTDYILSGRYADRHDIAAPAEKARLSLACDSLLIVALGEKTVYGSLMCSVSAESGPTWWGRRLHADRVAGAAPRLAEILRARDVAAAAKQLTHLGMDWAPLRVGAFEILEPHHQPSSVQVRLSIPRFPGLVGCGVGPAAGGCGRRVCSYHPLLGRASEGR